MPPPHWEDLDYEWDLYANVDTLTLMGISDYSQLVGHWVQGLTHKVDWIARSFKHFEGDLPLIEAEESYLRNIDFDFSEFPEFDPEQEYLGWKSGFQALASLQSLTLQFLIHALGLIYKEAKAAALPEPSSPRPHKYRPQLVIQFAEQNPDGTFEPAKYPLTIQHARDTGGLEQLPFDFWRKGRFYAYTQLSDGSEILLYAIGEDEARRMMNSVLTMVKPEFLDGYETRYGETVGSQRKEIVVYPSVAKYWAEGADGIEVKWVSYF